MKRKECYARLEDGRTCYECGRDIVGEYDYVRTRRGTELYFCKGMKCKKKEGEKCNDK